MAFGEVAYQEYPYINIDANATDETNKINLTDLFEYQDLEIPPPVPPPPDTEKYSILNIKKQFICETGDMIYWKSVIESEKI